MIKRRMPGNSSAGSSPLNRAVAAKAHPKINLSNRDGRMVEQSFSGGGSNLSNTSMSNNVLAIDLFPLLKGIVPDGSENFPLLNTLYRDIYYYDSVAGAAVDLMSFMPFSDLTLGGVEAKDKDKLGKFYESLDRINIRRLLPELSVDYLVLGTFIGSLVFNKAKGVFTDVIPQDIDHCSLQPLPFYSQDPIIKVSIAKETISALSGTSKRVERIKKKMGKEVIDKLLSGSFELDNLTTLYVPRKAFSSREGISWFKRILPIYLLEKNLFRGTIIESAKRQRSIMHITAGCLTGDTLVSVNGKLTRLDKICDRTGMKEGSYQDVSFKTKGKDGKIVEATKWWYQGKKRVNKIYTKSGASIKATDNHRILVLDSNLDLIWKEAKDIKIGDYLCQDSKLWSKTNKKLKLNVEKTLWKKTPFIYKTPSLMTPELSYLIGLILSEGTIREGAIIIGNTEMALLNKAQDCFEKVFGVKGTIRKIANAGPHSVRGKKGMRKDLYAIQVSSKFIIDIFKQLGLKTNSQLNPENLPKKISAKKTVPWSIMQADTESKYSFIAAYIDGDGSIYSSKSGSAVEMLLLSYSKKMLEQIQILLSDLGISSNKRNPNSKGIRISAHDGYEKIRKYMVHPTKESAAYDSTGLYNTSRGIPIDVILPSIASRFIGQEGERRQYTFLHDKGKEVRLKYFGSHVKDNLKNKKSIIYKNLKVKTSNLLSSLKQFSPELVSKIEGLVKIGYIFDPVISNSKIKEKKNVYDLTIAENAEPAFVANGLVVHNSSDWEPTINDLQFLTELFMNADADPIGAMVATRSDVNVNDIRQGGDFWNVTQVWSDTVPAKLRALGISEGFLSSESNYSEAQNSMTVFIEWLSSYRYMIERKVFIDKIFPLISVVNGYYNNEKDIKKWKNSEMDAEDILYELQDNSSLIIPKIHWHKQLKPEGDSDYLGMLNSLAEAGVPVTLRSMAAAGNLSLDQLVAEMEDDLKIRKQITDLKAKLESGDSAEGGGDEDYSETSSILGDQLTTLIKTSANNPYTSAALSKLQDKRGKGLRSITSRSYGADSEIKAKSKTGKDKYVHNQKDANRRINEMIAKAAAASHGTKGGRKTFFPTIKMR